MFGQLNPYQKAVDALEDAVAACERAFAAAEAVPFGRGGREISGPLHGVKSGLYESKAAAETYRDAFQYHMGRTDF